MQYEEEWELYSTQVEESPAAFRVDLGRVNEAPLAEYPFLAYITLAVQQSTEHGLPVEEEMQRLFAIEEALLFALAPGGDTVFVGVCSQDAQRDFFFYTASPEGWGDRIAAVMAGFLEYDWDCGTKEDPEWECYFEYLYPSVYEMQAIQNNHVLEQLNENGDDGSAPRPVDHWVLFPTREGCDAFCAKAKTQGYTVEEIEERLDPEEGDDEPEGEFQVRLSHEIAPENIDQYNMALIDLAIECDGEYDGWETSIVK